LSPLPVVEWTILDMARPCSCNQLGFRAIGALGLLGLLGLGLAGCSAQSTQRASLEFRPLVLEPGGGSLSLNGLERSSGGTTTLSSVPTE